MSRQYLLGDPAFDRLFLQTALVTYIEAYQATIARGRKEGNGSVGADDVMEAVEEQVVENLSRLFKRFTPQKFERFLQGYIQTTFELNDRVSALDQSIKQIIADLNLTDIRDSSRPLDSAEAAYYLTSSFSMMQFKLEAILPERLRTLVPIYKTIIELGTERQFSVEGLEKQLVKKAALRTEADTAMATACENEREVLELLVDESKKIVTAVSGIKKASKEVSNATEIYNDASRQLEQLSHNDFSELPHLAALQQRIDSKMAEVDSRIESYEKDIAAGDYQLKRLKEMAKTRFELGSYCPRLCSSKVKPQVAVEDALATPSSHGRERARAFDGSDEFGLSDSDTDDEVRSP
ncbi:MAG: hypothetical protein P1U63_03425 [Coxiellaceae bacterium]|nr:hypothetical protein [Coxiellaceae bacterium]